MTVQPPDPIVLEGSGYLRFAVGDRDGPRSSTWTVKAHRDGDVYVSSRGYMGTAKLSLHPPSGWRFAYTKEYAEHSGMVGDRLIQRLVPPDPIAPGWRRAATICVPMSSLRAPFAERQTARRPISWWPATTLGRAIFFEVLVSDASGFSQEATFDCIGEVGRVLLPNGAGAWVLADERDFQAWEESVAELRDRVRDRMAAAISAHADPAALAWGTANDDQRAMFFDLGDLSRPSPPNPAGG